MDSALIFSLLLKRIELSRNKRLSRADLEKKQLVKFRNLVSYITKRSPYYSDLVRRRSINVSTCAPEDFPVLTKTEVMENFDQMVTDQRITKKGISEFLDQSQNTADLYLNRFIVVNTSGSSGQVGISVFSKKDWACGFSQVIRNNPFSLFRPQRLVFFFAARGHFAGASWAETAKRVGFGHGKNILLIDINNPISEVVAALNSFQPHSIGGYVTGIKMLAEEKRNGTLKIAPSKIATSGEMLSKDDRRFIEEAFESAVTSSYGCTEHMIMGSTFPGETGMSLWEDDLIFEMRDECTLVTNLFNRTLPLIRYQMADTLSLVSEKTRHLPYTEIEEVIFRRETGAVFLNEDGLHDEINVDTVSRISAPELSQFQLQWISPQSFRVVACIAKHVEAVSLENIKERLVERITEMLATRKMSNLRFEVEFHDVLPVDPKTRKFRLIVGCPRLVGSR